MNTKTPLCMTAVLVLLSLTACRDMSYDLTDVDLELTLGGNIPVPVGSFQEILLKDVLELEGQSAITTDRNGDYSLSLKGSTTAGTVKMPDLSLDFQIDTVFSTGTISMNVQPGATSFRSADYDFNAGRHFKYSTDKVPEELADLGVCHLKNNSSLTFTFIESGLSSTDAYMKAGSVFYMPEWIQLASLSTDDYRLGDDGHSIYFTRDMRVCRTGTKISFDIESVDFGKMPAGDGIHNGTISVSGETGMKGQFYLKSDKFSDSGTASASIEASLVCGVCDLTDAEAKLHLAPSIDPVSMEVGSIKGISSDDVVLDLQDLRLLLALKNGLPLNGNLSAELCSWKNGSKVSSVSVAGIAIQASSNSLYALSENGWTTSNYKAMSVPGLASLAKVIPERFEIWDICVDMADEWVRYYPGKSYTFGLDYEVAAPLAFGTDLHLVCESDIEIGLDLGSNVSLNLVDFDLEISNTTPLRYSIEAQACDADGNLLSGSDIKCSSVVAAGSTGRPETSPVHIEASFDGNCRRIDILRLRFIAGMDDTHAGEAINEKQGITINNLVATIVDGVTIDLNKK